MSRSSVNHLKLYQEEASEARAPDIDSVASLPEVLAAFQDVTGWSLTFPGGSKPTCPIEHASSAPELPGVGTSLGHAILAPARSASAAPGRADRKSAARLATALAVLGEEMLAAYRAVWQREAELATAVPVAVRSDAAHGLAERLEALLRVTAESVDCQAAGLYLLDEGTTSLKLRSSWGLPQRRLVEPPRSLRGAKADLEALVGHAVVIEDAELLAAWRSPERSFASAACVPVTTPTNILGSLWVFSVAGREFGRQKTMALELAAGRLAAELEREVLAREAADAARWKRGLADAEHAQRAQLPGAPPLLDGWEVAGWVQEQRSLRNAFFDWFPLARGLVGIASGEVEAGSITGAISMTAVRAALRSHALYESDAGRLLGRVHDTLSSASRGDQTAALFCSAIAPGTDLVRYATAGPIRLLHFGQQGWRDLSRPQPRLGEVDAERFRQRRGRFDRGDFLVVLSGLPSRGQTSLEQAESASPTATRRAIVKAYLGRTGLPASDLVLVARDWLEQTSGGRDLSGASVQVLRRTGP